MNSKLHRLSKTDNKEETKEKSPNYYMKYTGMAFQMGGIILVGVLIGRKLDQYLETEQAIYTAIFALLATVGAMYSVIKDVMKK